MQKDSRHHFVSCEAGVNIALSLCFCHVHHMHYLGVSFFRTLIWYRANVIHVLYMITIVI